MVKDRWGRPAHGEPGEALRQVVTPVPEIGPAEALGYVLYAGLTYNTIFAARGVPISVFDLHDRDLHVPGSGAVALIAALGSEVAREGRLRVGELRVLYPGVSNLLSPRAGEDPMHADFKIQGYETPDGSFAQFVRGPGAAVARPHGAAHARRGLRLHAGPGDGVQGAVRRGARAAGRARLRGRRRRRHRHPCRRGGRAARRARDRPRLHRGQGPAGSRRRRPRLCQSQGAGHGGRVHAGAAGAGRARGVAAPRRGLPRARARGAGRRFHRRGRVLGGARSLRPDGRSPRAGRPARLLRRHQRLHADLSRQGGRGPAAEMLRRADLRPREGVLVYWGLEDGGDDDPVAAGATAAALAAGARVVVACRLDRQAARVKAAHAVQGVVSLETLARGGPIQLAGRDARLRHGSRRLSRAIRTPPSSRSASRWAVSSPPPTIRAAIPIWWWSGRGRTRWGSAPSWRAPSRGAWSSWRRPRAGASPSTRRTCGCTRSAILFPTFAVLGSHLSNAHQADEVVRLLDAGALPPHAPAVRDWAALAECHQLIHENRHAGT